MFIIVDLPDPLCADDRDELAAAEIPRSTLRIAWTVTAPVL